MYGGSELEGGGVKVLFFVFVGLVDSFCNFG